MLARDMCVCCRDVCVLGLVGGSGRGCLSVFAIAFVFEPVLALVVAFAIVKFDVAKARRHAIMLLGRNTHLTS